VSSGTAAGVADITNSPYNLEFNVISKALAVDTEVDPPQQNRGINPLATNRAAFQSTRRLF
jgi:hypothetical protein